jgi:hypothetical protein
MKKLMGLVLAIFCCNTLYALTPSSTTNFQINISRGLSLSSETKQEDGKELNYAINLTYPQLTGDSLSAAAQHFNEDINQYTNSEITEFENKVADNSAEANKLPESVRKNSFTLTYSAGAFAAADKTLVSIRFNKEYSFAGNAHPSHDIEVYNYDLTSGKKIKLDSLFKPNSDYLKVIADFCKAQLAKHAKNQKTVWSANGLAPTLANYDNWNIEPDGLIITFDEYQVTAYVEGQPEIFVPYKVLKSVLLPEAPVMACVKDPRTCRAVTGLTGDV